MAFFQKLLQKTNRSGRKLSSSDIKTNQKQPKFNEDDIRLVLFVDDIRGRQPIFDSKAIKKVEEDKVLGCRKGSWRIPKEKLSAVQEGCIQTDIKTKSGQAKYQFLRPGSDIKMLEELMFGAVGVAHKGTALKVHIRRNPSKLMLTKVFIPEKPKRLSASDLEESCGFSSAPDLTMPKQISQEHKGSSGIAHSIPMDVPSPRGSGVRSIDIIDEDSGLASLTSSGSFTAYPSPSSNTSSYNSIQRRWMRIQSTSLESVCRRLSQHDILSQSGQHTQSQELSSGAKSLTLTTSPARPKKCKIALGIVFDITEEDSEKENSLFEKFFFSHITLLEGHIEKLRLAVERAYYNKRNFLPIVMDAFDSFRGGILDLYTAPRLSEPVWLSMMSFSSYRYVLCDKFMHEFMAVVSRHDNKNTQFFISTLVTAVLTHHLAWVATVTPAGGTPSKTYLDKHSAKWVDTLAKTHPYNPMWAQLGDLYGAIGFPLKLSRTVIVGKKAELVKKLLYILSYFIRCSDILEIPEWGCLNSCLERASFPETPLDGDKKELMTPTPTAENTSMFDSGSFVYCLQDVTARVKGETAAIDINRIEEDCNSNNTPASGAAFSSGHVCPCCEKNRKLEWAENRVGRSVFYDMVASVDGDVCFCDKTKMDVPKRTMEENRDSGVGGCLDLPTDFADILNKPLLSGSLTKDEDSGLKECRLSAAEIIEDTKVQNVTHVRRAALNERVLSPSENLICEKSRSSPCLSERRSQLTLQLNVNKPGVDNKKSLTKEEIKAIYIKQGSDSMFDSYFGDEGGETKTIDDVDEKDRVVELHNVNANANRFSSCDKQKCLELEKSDKTPSLPDLTQVKSDSTDGKTGNEAGRSHRERLGSLDHHFRGRKPSFSRQKSEGGPSRINKFAPGRTRPVTPTELGRRRHLSSTSSFDFDFLDPSSYCKELPMPDITCESGCTSQKSFEKNFGRSLLADYSDHYMSDFVLHGTSDKMYHERLVGDVKMATQHSVLDEPIAEAVCIVADVDQWSVNVYRNRSQDHSGAVKQQPVVASQLVCNLMESVQHLWKLKMSPEFCIMHLEDRLQEIFFKSKMLAEYLKGTKNCNVSELTSMFGFDRSDMPLLVAIAGTHSPHLSLCTV